MKKTLLLLFVIVVFSPVLAAQEPGSESSGGGRFFLGIKGAIGLVQYESINTSVPDFAEMTFSNLSYGLVGGFNLTGKLGLQVEALFSQYGADNIIETYIYSPQSPVLQPYGEISVVDHVDMDLYYIDIPVLIKFTFSESGFSPFVYAGANWGINVAGNTTIVRKITESGEVFREFMDDISERVIFNEFAPVAGIGARMHMGSLTLLGDIRYKHGFKDLSNVDNNLGFTNRALWLSLGLVINL